MSDPAQLAKPVGQIAYETYYEGLTHAKWENSHQLSWDRVGAAVIEHHRDVCAAEGWARAKERSEDPCIEEDSQ